MHNAIEERILEIVADLMGVAQSQITRDMSFVDDLSVDSLHTVELVVEFEQEFGVIVTDQDAQQILTVGQAIDYIEEHAQRPDRQACPTESRFC